MKKLVLSIMVFCIGTMLFSQEKFTCPNGHFKATFPSKVEAKIDKSTQDGNAITLRNYLGQESSNIIYMVSVSEFPENHFGDMKNDKTKILDNAAEGFFGSLKIKQENRKEIKSGKIKGLEFSTNDNGYYLTYRVYVTPEKLFQVAVLGVEELPNKKKKDKFFKSFKILN